MKEINYIKEEFDKNFKKFFETNNLFDNFNSQNEYFSYFYQIIKDYSLNGGKRLRAIAFIFSLYDFLFNIKYDNKKFIEKNNCKEKNKKYFLINQNNFELKDINFFIPAIAIELHHTYSLILDDIMDEDEFRRNKPTAYKKLKEYYIKNFNEEIYDGNLFNKKSNRFAISFGIILGNLTNILSKKCILNSNFNIKIKYDSLNLLEETDREIYQGQILDLLYEELDLSKINEKDYLKMIKLKTGVLFGTAFQLGGLFFFHYKNNKDEIEDNSKLKILFNEIREAGINAAIGFQINDDLLDFTKSKGHEIGSDLKKQKKTLIFIKALQKLSNENRKKILSLNPNSDEKEVYNAIEVIKKTNAIEYAKKIKEYYYKKSEKILEKLNAKNLLMLVNYMKSL